MNAWLLRDPKDSVNLRVKAVSAPLDRSSLLIERRPPEAFSMNSSCNHWRELTMQVGHSEIKLTIKKREACVESVNCSKFHTFLGNTSMSFAENLTDQPQGLGRVEVCFRSPLNEDMLPCDVHRGANSSSSNARQQASPVSARCRKCSKKKRTFPKKRMARS